jgi:hypothetical protein
MPPKWSLQAAAGASFYANKKKIGQVSTTHGFDPGSSANKMEPLELRFKTPFHRTRHRSPSHFQTGTRLNQNEVQERSDRTRFKTLTRINLRFILVGQAVMF